MKPNRSRLRTVLGTSAILILTAGSAAAQDASSAAPQASRGLFAEGQVVVSADAGRGAPNPTYQGPH